MWLLALSLVAGGAAAVIYGRMGATRG
jgi:hypothetical protein